MKQFDLQDGYTLLEASVPDFARASLVYAMENPPFDSYANCEAPLLSEYKSYSGHLYWIYEKRRKIGGVLIMPNFLAGFFLLPALDDSQSDCLFAKLDCLLSELSDPEKEQTVISGHFGLSRYFMAHGYHSTRRRCAMYAATYDAGITLPEGYALRSIEAYTLAQIAEFFCHAHIGSANDTGITPDAIARREKELDYFLKQFRENGSIGCSAVAVDENNTPAGICLAGATDGDAGFIGVVDVAVLPAFRARGLGGALLCHTIATAREHSPLVFLGVERENPARRLYQNLGFVDYSRRDFLTRD